MPDFFKFKCKLVFLLDKKMTKIIFRKKEKGLFRRMKNYIATLPGKTLKP